MKHINEIATELGLDSANLVPYGKYKAKIPLTEIKRNGMATIGSKTQYIIERSIII